MMAFNINLLKLKANTKKADSETLYKRRDKLFSKTLKGF